MANCLPKDYPLKFENRSGEYAVISVLGRGASTIAYLTNYTDETGQVSERIIKEYCPYSLNLVRDESGAIICAENDALKYEQGLERFKEGGKCQNELRNKVALKNSIPPMQGIYVANNTLYLEVTPYEGKTLDRLPELSLAQRIKICLTIAKLVNRYHKQGYLCLDIKPENIFILINDGEIVTEQVEYIDFDSVCKVEEVSFEKSLSYTEAWAAPEQINPYSYKKISEATDVYAIGELVFWLVFGRHSGGDEHRGFSTYPFDKSALVELNRGAVRVLLKQLFGRTIRSSVNNRFDTLGPVISLLEKLTEEVSKKETLNNYEVFSKDFFVGREVELELLANTLKNHKIVFVSGVPGIGKSEVVKNYVKHHKEEFHDILYWFYEGDFEKMICNDHSVSISNFKRERNETDKEYSHRKLNKLSSLVNEHTLTIIDNLDVLVEEIPYSDLWNKIKSFPGKILITTRCEQKNYETIIISEIESDDYLVDIFNKHCPSCVEVEGEDLAVKQIIEFANKHTYEIELLAAHAEAEKKLPSELLQDMQTYGIGSFDKTEISSVKDGQDESLTFSNHLQKILSLNKLSDEQKKMLLKLSFMPNGGVDIRAFKTFYSITDYNTLNWLVGHGLVYETKDSRHIITIHPAVAEIAIGIMRQDNTIINRFYEEAMTAMRKGYEDESVNKEVLLKMHSYVKESLYDKKNIQAYNENALTDVNLKTKIDEVLKDIDSQYAPNDIDQVIYILLCESLVQKSLLYQISGELVARFLAQYVQWFMRYGRFEFLREVILGAKKIYDLIDSSSYFQDRECMYDMYVLLLLKNEKLAIEALDVSKKHLQNAISAKDWHFASDWCYNIAMSYYHMNDQDSGHKYQIKGMGYSLKSIFSHSYKKYSNNFLPDKYSRTARALWFNEQAYEECVAMGGVSKFSLRMAIFNRKLMGSSNENDLSLNHIKILIDKSKIKMLQEDFAGAKEELAPFLSSYRRGELKSTEVSYEAFSLLGEICTIMSEYKEALNSYFECVSIAKELEYQDVHSINSKIGRLYNLCGDLESSREFNTRLLQEMEEKNIEASEYVLADVYYNIAELHRLTDDYKTALEFLAKAESLYKKYEQWRNHCKIGKSRCMIMKAQVLNESNHKEEGNALMWEGIEALEKILGSSHPEVCRLRK